MHSLKLMFALCAALILMAPILPYLSAAIATTGGDRVTATRARVETQLNQAYAAIDRKLGDPVFMRIFKEPGTLELWVGNARGDYALLKSYPICRYSGELGPKRREGDGQAPEGIYSVRAAQLNPRSTFHLSFNLGYPNAYDRAHGYTGSYLMVHGNCVSIGCYAMTDGGIEEIYVALLAALQAGQPMVAVHAFPFALTEEQMGAHSLHPEILFWRELQPVFQAFESTHRPPTVTVRAKRYALVTSP